MCGALCVTPATDGKNCGGCGHDCLGGMCTGGACQAFALATGQQNPLGLSMDGANLYWANEQGGTVMSVPKNGGATAVVAAGQNAPWGTATDGVKVFWVTINGGTLMSAPIAGGTPKTLASGLNGPGAIALSATNVYWADGAGISFMPKGGGAKMTLTTQQTAWLLLDASYAYWTFLPGSALVRAPLLGGAPLTLNANLGSPSGPAISGGFIYVGNGANVLRVPIGGGGAMTLVTDPSGSVSSVAANGTSVYWTNSGAGSLEKAPVAGGAAVGLASGQNDPGYVLTDSAAIYWIDIGGSVMELSR